MAAWTLDATFGVSGKVTTDLGGNDAAFAVFPLSGGKLLAAGSSGSSFALVRYDTGGQPDPAFGTAGIVRTGSPVAIAAALQPDGRIVSAGARGYDLAVARFLADGRADPFFGDQGTAAMHLARTDRDGHADCNRPPCVRGGLCH
jgi:uncharacterized delta-60 repeat protein